ncbi:preprotein translocase SecA [Thalassotalea profundi]|uniref:Preprotein translocase SecA n=2 Tax=Thalassotalea profundi TaxID=2036687 RepID=A0ABQ3ITG0_9GAMM|nr:preprotein translocase SecA [Thalassotalea profundi]
MRSRYSAYAVKNAEYIYKTYANYKQKENTIIDILQWAEQTHWLKLNINDSSHTAIDNFNPQVLPTVIFDAYYLHQQQLYKMSECSRFVIEQNQWRYLDGNIFEHIKLNHPKRNDTCFCSSGKKFKKCCAKTIKPLMVLLQQSLVPNSTMHRH